MSTGYIQDIANLLSDIDLTLFRGKKATSNGLELCQQIDNSQYKGIGIKVRTKLPEPGVWYHDDNCIYLYREDNNQRIGSITIERRHYAIQVRVRVFGRMKASRWETEDTAEIMKMLHELLDEFCIILHRPPL